MAPEAEMVESAAADIKLFIKDEPHKIQKLREGRQRLISCLALEDQVLDRILFCGWQKSEIADPFNCASKAGWSPIPLGYKQFLDCFSSDSDSLAIDKTAWDWTMPGWVVFCYMAVKMQQVRNPTLEYAVMVYNRLREVVGPGAVFREPNGRRLQQVHWGLMKSGWFLTLSMNSMAQAAQHELSLLRIGVSVRMPVWAMGDDSLIRWNFEANVDRYLEELKKTGCIVKHHKWQREFCGFYIGGDVINPVVKPLYGDKHRFVLAYLDEKVRDDLELSYTLLYALSNERWISDLSKNFKYPLSSMQKAWAKGLMDLNLV